MKDDHSKPLGDPTNRIVCIFADVPTAEKARLALVDLGFEARQLSLLTGDDAGDIDASAKWFADTDKELKKFQRELQQGYVAIAVPVNDTGTRQEINELLQHHGAQHVTHFGDWTTEVMR